MDSNVEKINKIRNCTKEELIDKIINAKNDISMIGSIAFNLPWDELIVEISKKFKKDDFTIHILRESETTIAQYALLAMSQEKEDYGNLSRGNLTGIKDKVIKELKDILYEENHGANIEPPEDQFAQELGKIYYKEKRNYILKSYAINGCMEEFNKYIENNIKELILDTKKKFLGHEEFVTLITGKIGEDPEIVSRFARAVDEVLQKAINEKVYFFKNTNVLETLDIKNVEDLYEKVDKKGKTTIFLRLTVEAEGLNLVQDVELPIETYIDQFLVAENKGDVNYRLKNDKEQATNKATEVRNRKLEEYQNDPTKRQRLFIKNCYMPIPVPMIKIDNELFITMALTKFDNIGKFQYVGNITFDEESKKYKAAEGKEGYRSLWLDEFVNYYEEYFINENGAQRYSTEETAEANRKEVIDIFDESRCRIGNGPRDAFLSNMAIVKSVVWALIFDRKGRILIHQRAKNAKDNQGLWDKSVGGHVSIEDLDTVEAINREITEELFTIEHEGQGGHDSIDWMITNKNKIIYLGDWKTDRFPDLTMLKLRGDEYYNFSLNYPDISKRDFRREIVITERVLPNGETVKAKCFVDAYLCIVAENFDISKLENSNYALLTPNELKRCVLRKTIRLNNKREYDSEGELEEEFRPTSDLAYLVESGIWDDVVTEFAKRVSETYQK